MSTAIGIILFVVGAGALVLSVLMDRRPSQTARPSRDRARPAETDAPVPVEPQASEPETPGPDTPEPRTPEPDVLEHSMAAEGAASAAHERLAKLRAELVATPEPESEMAARAEPEPEPVAPAEASVRTDAGRVFAAVASVGRAPEEPTFAEPPIPVAAEDEPSPPVVSAEPAVPAPDETPDARDDAGGGAAHGHTVPLVNHSDLVTHLRREHPSLDASGSTIQMRLLHERDHAG